jgi:hypothetical protein
MPRFSKPATSKPLTARMLRLKHFVPCFFDLPLKHVLEILCVSHHTIDPIRRSLSLKRWPYVDLMRGKFGSRNQVVALRAQMMPEADEDMQRILCKVATQAERCWNETPENVRVLANCQDTFAKQAPPVPEAREAVHQPSIWDDPPQAEDDSLFWHEMSDLLSLRDAVMDEPCLPAFPEALARS